MGDLTSALRELLEQRRETWSVAQPGPELRAGLVRRRRLRTGLWTAGAAACVAVVGVAAAPAVIDAVEPAPAPAPAPSLSPEPVPTSAPPTYAQATVPFDDPESGWLDYPLTLEPPFCGEPLPANLGARDGFRVEHAIPDAVVMQQGIYTESVQASAGIRYGRYDEFPVVVDPMVGLIARGGEVVGWLPGTSPRGLNTFVGGASTTVSWEGLGGYAIACGSDAVDGLGVLEPGEYQLAWMTRVHSSEQAIARAHLSSLGYVIPSSGGSAAFREGSYECEQRVERGGTVPITCDPGAVPGTVVDREADEVTVPYPENALGREVDVRFVTTSVPLTIEPQPEDPLEVVEQQHPAHVPGEPMACGDEYSGLDAGPVSLDRSSPDRGLRFGTDVYVDVWNEGATWQEATVELPSNARLWITQREQRRTALSNGDSFGYALHRVVGWADLTLPPRVDLVRFDGPARAIVGVGDVTWCDGLPNVSEAALTLSVLATHTVTDQAGPHTFQTLRMG